MSTGNPSTDYTASNLLAQITQAQYQNYQSLYSPIENQQIAYATNPGTIPLAQQQAGASSTAASTGTAQGLQKSLEGQGIKLSPDQQAAVSSKLGLQASLNKVGAMNTAGTATYDTISQTLAGGAPNLSNLTSNINQNV
jgi:hypothetical protein